MKASPAKNPIQIFRAGVVRGLRCRFVERQTSIGRKTNQHRSKARQATAGSSKVKDAKSDLSQTRAEARTKARELEVHDEDVLRGAL